MNDETARLAAEIRRHVMFDDGWWHPERVELPEALAADLIAAGWQPPATRAMTAAERAEFAAPTFAAPTDDPEAMRALGYQRLNDIPPNFVNNWVAKP